MELLNEQVTHLIFGEGKIVSLENGFVSIAFSGAAGLKKFCYPSAFGNYLTMCKPEAQALVLTDLHALETQIAEERAEKERLSLEDELRRAEEKKAIRKAATKKTVKKQPQKV